MKPKAKATESKKNRVISMAASSIKKKSLSWYDKLDPEDKKWLDELKEEFRSGSHPGISMESLARAVSSELGINILGNAFRIWMRK